MADSRQASLMRIACGGGRTAKSRFPFRALLFSLLPLRVGVGAPSPNEKSWRARGATGDRVRSRSSAARARSLASSLALRRTSQLVAGGRLHGEHVTLENCLKEEQSVSHTKWFDRRRLGEWIAASSRTISFGGSKIVN